MSRGKLEGGKEFFNEWLGLTKEWQRDYLFGEELGAAQLEALDEVRYMDCILTVYRTCVRLVLHS